MNRLGSVNLLLGLDRSIGDLSTAGELALLCSSAGELAVYSGDELVQLRSCCAVTGEAARS
jgi:hypothetical protein